MIDKDGNSISEFDTENYLDYIEEKVQPWSYMKFPFMKQIGFPDGNYRVGPLARLNIVDSVPTEKASHYTENTRINMGSHKILFFTITHV